MDEPLGHRLPPGRVAKPSPNFPAAVASMRQGLDRATPRGLRTASAATRDNLRVPREVTARCHSPLLQRTRAVPLPVSAPCRAPTFPYSPGLGEAMRRACCRSRPERRRASDHGRVGVRRRPASQPTSPPSTTPASGCERHVCRHADDDAHRQAQYGGKHDRGPDAHRSTSIPSSRPDSNRRPFFIIERATSQGVHRTAKRPRVGGP